MKVAIIAVVCLSLVLCVTSNDLNVGQREDGDILVASRRLLRLGVPGKSMVARTGFNAAGTITAINAVNAHESNANVTIVKGGPGTSSVVVVAISEPGSGIDVLVDIYAKLDNPTTSA